MVETQSSLERQLELIETHQQEVHDRTIISLIRKWTRQYWIHRVNHLNSLLLFKVDKALQSMEEEAERIYNDERKLLLDDEAASTRDAMWELSSLSTILMDNERKTTEYDVIYAYKLLYLVHPSLISCFIIHIHGFHFRYEQSELVERELEHMTEQIRSIIQSVNANQVRHRLSYIFLCCCEHHWPFFMCKIGWRTWSNRWDESTRCSCEDLEQSTQFLNVDWWESKFCKLFS